MNLTADVIKAVHEASIVGVPERFVAAELGICQRSYFNWKRRGKQLDREIQMEGRDPESLDDNERLYLQFFQHLEKGRASGVRASLGRIRSAGKKQWQAEAWYLERVYPDLFGRRDRREIEMAANVKHTQDIDLSKLSDETLERVVAELGVTVADDDADEDEYGVGEGDT